MADLQYIDLETGLSRVRGNKKLFARMLGMFVASEEFQKLEDALSAGNNAAAGDVAHAIKGMSGNLGLDAVFEYSTRLMTQLRQGDADAATLEQYRAALEKTLVQARELAATLTQE